jgi:DNA-binding SARP family transcriptional activator
VEFRLLGPLTAIVDGRELDVGSPRERTLLAALVLERGRIVPIARLVDAIWGEAPPTSARTQVHVCVSALRRRFEQAGERIMIETRQPGYALRAEEGHCDLDEFVRRTTIGRCHADANRQRDAARELRAALDLWRGPPLTNVTSVIVQDAVLGFTELYASAMEDWLEACLALGHHAEVCRDVARLVDIYPLRERLRRQQVIALYRAGRVADALDAYRRARRAFIDELGLDPSPHFQQLERAVLTHDPVLGAPGAGLHGPASLIPEVPKQLPPGTGSLTGRQESIEQLRAALRPGDSFLPVVLVTGPAGAGKTALAVHVCHLVRDRFPDGQLFVDLHGREARPVTSASALERFLRAFGVSESAIPVAVEDRIALYRSLVADRRLLVMLDDASSESQVRELLPGGASCGVIVTSRRRLTGLSSVAWADIGVLGTADAIEMLEALAGRHIAAADPNARALVRLCGGLPLALHIAAARLAAHPHWSVGNLVARMDNERQRLDELAHGELGVRESISGTYASLAPQAQRLFRLLGLLEVAGFPAWVGAPLLNDELAAAQELLEHLVEARMVEVAAARDGEVTRYRVHELFRVYARERLATEESAADRQQALTRFADSARQRGLINGLAEPSRTDVGGQHAHRHSHPPGSGPKGRQNLITST